MKTPEELAEKHSHVGMRPMFGYIGGSWHQWFAWHPIITYDGRMIWLKRVWRNRAFPYEYCTNATPWWWYQVECPFDGNNK
jgi:hypothetical protein